ncbi:MAG: PQQ-binding-like beta-propeller repeat protein [Planctomycetaceae bacterium]
MNSSIESSRVRLKDYPGLSLDAVVEVSPNHRGVLPLAVEVTHPELLPHFWGTQGGTLTPSNSLAWHYYFSDDSLLAIGDAAWRSGDVDAAANCWNAVWYRLSGGTANVGSPLVRSAVAARLATWDAMAGRPGSARNWLSALNDEERDGIARFAGRSGTWGELMESVIESETPTAERASFALTRQVRVPIEHASKDALPTMHLVNGDILLLQHDSVALWSQTVEGEFRLNQQMPLSLLSAKNSMGTAAPSDEGGGDWLFSVSIDESGQRKVVVIDGSRATMNAWTISGDILMHEAGWMVTSPPLIAAGLVYVTLSDQKRGGRQLVCCVTFDKEPQVLWRTELESLIASQGPSEVGCSLSRWESAVSTVFPGEFAPPVLLVNVEGRQITGLNCQNGQLMWAREYKQRMHRSTVPFPDIHCGELDALAVTAEGIVRFDPRTGRQLWLSSGGVRSPARILLREDDRLVTAGGGLRALDIATGVQAWELKGPGGESDPLAHVAFWKRHLLYARDDSLRLVDVRSGTTLRQWYYVQLGFSRRPAIQASGNYIYLCDGQSLMRFEAISRNLPGDREVSE